MDVKKLVLITACMGISGSVQTETVDMKTFMIDLIIKPAKTFINQILIPSQGNALSVRSWNIRKLAALNKLPNADTTSMKNVGSTDIKLTKPLWLGKKNSPHNINSVQYWNDTCNRIATFKQLPHQTHMRRFGKHGYVRFRNQKAAHM